MYVHSKSVSHALETKHKSGCTALLHQTVAPAHLNLPSAGRSDPRCTMAPTTTTHHQHRTSIPTGQRWQGTAQGKKAEARADSFESAAAGLAVAQHKVRMAADQVTGTSRSTGEALEALSGEVRSLRREQKKAQVRGLATRRLHAVCAAGFPLWHAMEVCTPAMR